MSKTSKWMTIAAAVLAVGCAMSGCADDEVLPSDSANASFGGGAGKADFLFSVCEQSEVLKLLNESTSNPDELRAQGINSQAATNVWAHRLGPDGQLGTADDNIFDDFDELDSVYFVGPKTLAQLVDAVVDRCHESIKERPYIDQETFANSSWKVTGRDNVELEAAMTVTGITGQRLHAILSEVQDDGDTGFHNLRKYKGMEGLTYDFGVDEVPWNKESMQVREALGMVALTIEPTRFQVDRDDDDGDRELSLGTDIMDDTYYDTKNFGLLAADMVVRGRVRWDNEDTIRRLLIAAKFDSKIGDDGIKRAAKIDIRTDYDAMARAAVLDDDVMRGMVSWNGSARPIQPLEAVYQRLQELDALPDMQGKEDVLLLDPKVHMRSYRSRYHLNEAAVSDLRRYYQNGLDRITTVNQIVEAKLADGTIDPSVRADAEALVALGKGILDGEAIRARAGAGIAVTRADQFSSAQSIENLEELRAVADAIYDATHDYAELLDDLDNDIAGVEGLATDDDFADMFIEWRKARKNSLRIKTIAKPFISEYEQQKQNLDAALADFNAYGQEQLAAGNDDFEDFVTVTPQIFDDIGKLLADEDLGDAHRMIATSGIMARALWFDTARRFYVPNSSRSDFDNFMIDTLDFTEMITKEEWNSIPDDARSPAYAFDPAKVYHSMLVNEVQIELGKEEAYLKRIEDLKAKLEANPGDIETELMLEGARFVFDTYRDALTTIAEVKGEEYLDELEDNGGPDTMAWAPSVASKGKTALLILSDQD